MVNGYKIFMRNIGAHFDSAKKYEAAHQKLLIRNYMQNIGACSSVVALEILLLAI